jgi:hypothetical protein
MMTISIDKAIEFSEELKADAGKNGELTHSEYLAIKIYLDRMVIKLMDVKVNQTIKEKLNANTK